MRKQFELTCPVHASPPSPSQLCNKSILSCQAAALRKDALREETSHQKAALSGECCKSFSSRRSETSHRRGGVFKDTPTVSPLLRCQSKSSHQVLLTAVTLLRWLIIPLTQWSWRYFLTLSTHRFSLRVWMFVATLPPSKQNVLAQGGKKISLKTLMQHLFIYFRNSGVESVFCSKEQVKEMFLVKGIFLSGLLTFLEVH